MSRRSSRPWFFLAETSTDGISPPHDSTRTSCSASCCLTRSGLAFAFVDLVDGHDQRHVGGAGVVDGLLGLRHDAVVGRHHQDHDVGDLGAAGAHLGEGLVARGVDKDDRPPVGRLDPRGADVLGDATGLLLGDAARPDRVEQRGLSVIDVTHDGHDRRPRFCRSSCLGTFLALVLDELLGGRHHRLDLEIGADLLRQLVRQRLVGGDHHALLDQQSEELLGGDVELFGELAGGHHLRQDDRTFGLLAVLELDGPGRPRRRGAALVVLAAGGGPSCSVGRRPGRGAGRVGGLRLPAGP